MENLQRHIAYICEDDVKKRVVVGEFDVCIKKKNRKLRTRRRVANFVRGLVDWRTFE